MLNIKLNILKNAGYQTVDGPYTRYPTDFYSIYYPTIEVNVVLIFKISSLCVQHKKEMYTGLEQHVGK